MDDSDDALSYSPEEGGRPRWISCTPLFGSDDRVGVWMVVMVENERISGSLPSRGRRPPDGRSASIVGSERGRGREGMESDGRWRARSRRSGERDNNGSGAGARSGSGVGAGMPPVGVHAGAGAGVDVGAGVGRDMGNAVGSDSGKWFSGYPNGAPPQGRDVERRRRSKESASTGGGTGASAFTSDESSI